MRRQQQPKRPTSKQQKITSFFTAPITNRSGHISSVEANKENVPLSGSAAIAMKTDTLSTSEHMQISSHVQSLRSVTSQIPSDAQATEGLANDLCPAGSIPSTGARIQPSSDNVSQNTAADRSDSSVSWWSVSAPQSQWQSDSLAPSVAKRQSSLGSQYGVKRPRLQAEARPTKRPAGMASQASGSARAVTSASQLMQGLSPAQAYVLERVVTHGESTFFTGAAGTGKSFLLRQIVSRLTDRFGANSPRVAVTATTGLAGLNINGSTLHKWSGMGLGTAPAAEIVRKISTAKTLSMREAKLRWNRVQVLVIDEVSMLHADTFDKLEEIARLIRHSNKPFGGIQVVLTGDFFQLPPITSREQSKLCFEAKCWDRVLTRRICLSKIFRQSDTRLVEMLNAMRTGNLSDHMVAQFKALQRQINYDDGIVPTELFARREDVERSNDQRISSLPGPEFVYQSQDQPMADWIQKQLDANTLATRMLRLRIGAQVMLVYNIDDNLVNGLRGIVRTFVNPEAWPFLEQLFMFHRGAVDAYNGLLRADGAVDAHVAAQLREIGLPTREETRLVKAARGERKHMMPIVDFRRGAWALITPRDFQLDGGNRKLPGSGYDSDATRQQVPLVPAWALSIHKAQGQTIDRVIVDLRRVFERGQAYVAVSRATSYDRLQVIGFRKECVMVDPRVSDFYSKLDDDTSKMTSRYA